ncbi:alpha/beta fold hydrolase [Streptomyces sp. NPDC002851]
MPAQVRGAEPVKVVEHELSFKGFDFTCRIVQQSAPVTEPLVLLGGSSQDRFSWTRYERPLAPLCTMVTVDLPGYGSADFLPACYDIDFLTDAVCHMLDELGLHRANLLGACFGGAIALRFAQRYPDFLRRLILVGMTKYIPEEYAAFVPRWLQMLEDGRNSDIAQELVDLFMSPPGTGTVRKHAAVSRLLYRQFMARTPDQISMDVEHNGRLMGHDWYRPQPVPDVPALVLTGEHDTLMPPEQGREVAAALAGAWFTSVKEADHLLVVERIEETADLLARFCTDRPIDDLPYCGPVEFVPPDGTSSPAPGLLSGVGHTPGEFDTGAG